MYIAALALCLGYATALTVPVADAVAVDDRTFVKVPLPAPDDWLLVGQMVARIVDTFTGEPDKYTDQTWQDYTMEKCKATTVCTTTFIYKLMGDSVNGQTELWYGEIYSGTAATPENFLREGHRVGLTNSQAWTVDDVTGS